MVRIQIEIFNDELCASDWYALPIDMQKLLVAFLPCTQRVLIIRGYANTECTRDAFKRVNFNHPQSSTHSILILILNCKNLI